jgi:hypothetical protein
MKKLVLLGLLCGCTEVADYLKDAVIVDIDGVEFFVAERPNNGKNVYVAGANKPKGSSLIYTDFSLPIASIAAIEKVTGCNVVPETVVNSGAGTTFAAVDCN